MQEHQPIQESMAEGGWLWRRAQKYQAIRDSDFDRAQALDAEEERSGAEKDPGSRARKGDGSREYETGHCRGPRDSSEEISGKRFLATPHPDRRIHAPRAGDRRGSVNIRDFGDEVHLWFEQRVPWLVALQILKELTHDAASRPRGSRRRVRAPIRLPPEIVAFPPAR
jgi:hypothetical protein